MIIIEIRRGLSRSATDCTNLQQSVRCVFSPNVYMLTTTGSFFHILELSTPVAAGRACSHPDGRDCKPQTGHPHIDLDREAQGYRTDQNFSAWWSLQPLRFCFPLSNLHLGHVTRAGVHHQSYLLHFSPGCSVGASLASKVAHSFVPRPSV